VGTAALGWTVAGVGVGLMEPAYQSLISKAVPNRLRGTAFGLFSSSLGVFSLPAPAIGAWLWETIGPRAPFAITAGASLVAMIPAWLKFKIDKPVDDETPASGPAPDLPAGLSGGPAPAEGFQDD
jgi:MFS family permease